MTKDRMRFRVYLEAEQRMSYSEDWADISWQQVTEWARQGLLMQVTGFRDHCGKDVYEGDVVEVYNTYKEESFRGSVHFGNNGWYIRKNDLTSHGRWINYDITILGNLFETPKLLNEE